MKLFEDLEENTAEFSPCGTYRYTLTRHWGDGPCVAWLMLNPSTATAEVDDPTIRRCIGFSKRWEYGRLVILNLFAFRSTDPRKLATVVDPVGPMNNYWIRESLNDAREVVCAWGCKQHLCTPELAARPAQALALIPKTKPVVCLGYRADGAPRHPLMVPYEQARVRFERNGSI